VNERWLEYWASKFASRGFVGLDVLRSIIWGDTDIAWWYRQNVVVFANSAGLDHNPPLVSLGRSDIGARSLIHPDLYARTLRTLSAVSENYQQLLSLMEHCYDEGGTYKFFKDDEGKVAIARS
jgi:hypothetical protein